MSRLQADPESGEGKKLATEPRPAVPDSASSLARLLEEHRGAPNPKNRPPLTAGQILVWADAYFSRHGRWPQVRSGPIEDAPGETWSAVNAALEQGLRTLPGGSSLAKLLAQQRGVRNRRGLPKLTEGQVLAWVVARIGFGIHEKFLLPAF